MRYNMTRDVAIPPKYKPRSRQIQELRLADRRFQDLWAEYCELLESLKPMEGGVDTLNRLKKELEGDIEEALQNKPGN